MDCISRPLTPGGVPSELPQLHPEAGFIPVVMLGHHHSHCSHQHPRSQDHYHLHLIKLHYICTLSTLPPRPVYRSHLNQARPRFICKDGGFILPVCFLISDAPVSPPLLLSSTPRIHARDHSYSHCKLSYLDLVTLCFTHLSSPPGYSSVSFNKYPCVITYLCVS